MPPASARVLTVNGGSSSIKLALFEVGASVRRILDGGVDRIGLPDATFQMKGPREAVELGLGVWEAAGLGSRSCRLVNPASSRPRG